MIKFLVVEDEFTIALDIEQRLIKLGFESLGIARSYNEALPVLLETNPDIVLLDINLGSGKSGIDLGKLITERFKIPIVFLTAYSDEKTFAKAEEAKPMGYIIKPFNDNDIKRTIIIATERYRKAVSVPNAALSNEKKSDILFVKDKNNITKIHVDDILWLEAMDNYTFIYVSESKWIVNLFLKDVLEKLEPNRFVRIHRSYAVSIDKITAIEENTLFIGKKHLNISRTYKKEFLEKLNLI